jgi:tellurium resistance protein TerD
LGPAVTKKGSIHKNSYGLAYPGAGRRRFDHFWLIPQTQLKENTMAVSLTKGGNISLTKTEPGLKEIMVGLGWDPRASEGDEFDLDASVFLLKADGKVRSDADFIFYNNLVSSDGSVRHTGDNRSGAGEGDDESIEVNLMRVPADVAKLVFTVTIENADARHQNFGMVGSAFIRIVNDERGSEIARYDLVEEASTAAAMVFGEVYRYNDEWKFRAIGQTYKGGLGEMARMFGVNV